eukprot:CAMPEP_0185600614 /NCGR_PEP_ID=MMETSP0436-20130131/539_1 /TAXON_ID=626734 ORGANISM="Favella taraikaensis, Strain Fe Narragansett Bay" /NCGR_SAMPLE_ID=MMETSP0436 /ASSEMBLY_ACC=CAM_ASM_000390 /LENGTH=237 /DNA_ID=CAMNT_0028230361 /DNA_START=246 /DNA_END=961 /DNA_ORIENTATION=+
MTRSTALSLKDSGSVISMSLSSAYAEPRLPRPPPGSVAGPSRPKGRIKDSFVLVAFDLGELVLFEERDEASLVLLHVDFRHEVAHAHQLQETEEVSLLVQLLQGELVALMSLNATFEALATPEAETAAEEARGQKLQVGVIVAQLCLETLLQVSPGLVVVLRVCVRPHTLRVGRRVDLGDELLVVAEIFIAPEKVEEYAPDERHETTNQRQRRFNRLDRVLDFLVFACLEIGRLHDR